jgi:hypothetical protein
MSSQLGYRHAAALRKIKYNGELPKRLSSAFLNKIPLDVLGRVVTILEMEIQTLTLEGVPVTDSKRRKAEARWMHAFEIQKERAEKQRKLMEITDATLTE